MTDAIETAVQQAVMNTLAFAKSEILRDAQSKLHGTYTSYARGVSGVKMTGKTSGEIALKGRFPLMLESGAPAFDMKQGFSKSPNVRRGKRGWYMTIPLRHRTSGHYKMPTNVIREARKLSGGERLKEALVRELGYKPETSHAGYTWKNAKYDSMQRIVQTSQPSGKQSGQYMTFRRVSQASDPSSWQHPGLKGVKAFDNVAEKAAKYLESELGG